MISADTGLGIMKINLHDSKALSRSERGIMACQPAVGPRLFAARTREIGGLRVRADKDRTHFIQLEPGDARLRLRKPT